MIWSKKDKTKRADTKKQPTGFTMLLIPNSSDSAKTVEITYDRLLQLFAGAIATAIIVIGLIVSMMVHNHKLKNSLGDAETAVSELSASNAMLEETVTALNDQIDADKEAFSKIEDTITKKEEEDAASAEEAAVPYSLPISNAEAVLVEDPYRDSNGGATNGIVLATTKGAIVSAAANGVIMHVDSDENNPFYTRGIVIDHGNGYITYYRMNGDVATEEGVNVAQGDVLAVLTEDGYVAYEIKKDGEFVDPATMIRE